MKISKIVSVGLGLVLATTFVIAHAGVVVVPYTGTYDERTSAPSGDYDAIGGLIDVGQFNLLAGNNFFLGGIKTPSDSSDVFLISIGTGLKIVGATIQWGTNANASNAMFATPGPVWTLEESDSDPTIFLVQNLRGNGRTSPLSFTAPTFERGPGLYSMTIGNGVFGMNNGAPIAYNMDFIVVSTTATGPTNVPEPASLALLGLGLAGLGFSRRRKA